MMVVNATMLLIAGDARGLVLVLVSRLEALASAHVELPLALVLSVLVGASYAAVLVQV